MRATWISQGGFIFECGAFRLVVDPYLSDDLARLGHVRMSKPAVSYGQLKPDAVLFTHDHLDHYDPVTVGEILSLYPECRFVGPSSVYEHHKKLGRDCSGFEILNAGDDVSLGGFCIRAVKSFHSDPMAVGLIISADGKTVYFSGDTLYDAALHKEILGASPQGIDAAFVCINGKLGNMNWCQAACLVREISAARAIPMHYGLFADNTEDPAPFAKMLTANGVRVFIPTEGEPFEV